MKAIYLTAGAAGMYCGSCMRDNTLVAALRRQGRDVRLVPLYTLIRTDEEDVSDGPVLYGGVNVYLQQKSAFFRHTPWLLDRLLDSRALLRRVSRGAGKASPSELGEMTVSMLSGEHGQQRKELAKLVRWISDARPNIVNLPNAMFAGAARAIRSALDVSIVCTLTGEDIFLERLPPEHRSKALRLIREHGRYIDAFVAVSRYYAEFAGGYFAVPQERLHVIPLGVRVDRFSHEPPPEEPFTIGYLARICPEKGLHILCEAFLALRRAGRSCRMRVAGYCGPSDRDYLRGIRLHLAQEGLEDAVDFVGEVDREGKISFLDSLHVLSVPTVYREAKGLYVLESLARGVPVVQPRHGAFSEMIESTGGGLLFEPGDPQALAACVIELMDNRVLRRHLGCRGRESVLESYTDEVMAQRTWNFYERQVAAHAKAR